MSDLFLKRITLCLGVAITFSHCYEYDLQVTRDKAPLRVSPLRRGRILARLPANTILKNSTKKEQWYFVPQQTIPTAETKIPSGYIYRDDVGRAHHMRHIFSNQFRANDSLALMITLPVFFILLGAVLLLSQSKSVRITAASIFFVLFSIQSIYVLAKSRAKMGAFNERFRRMSEFLTPRFEKGAVVYYTDFTWPAHLEVLSGFRSHFDRFAKDGYNRKSKLVPLTTRFRTATRGVYILVDRRYLGQGSWKLPSWLIAGQIPSNWKPVFRYGKAILYYAS